MKTVAQQATIGHKPQRSVGRNASAVLDKADQH